MRSVPAAVPTTFLMQITVATASVTELRQLVMKTCGGVLSFMRIEPLSPLTRCNPRYTVCPPVAASNVRHCHSIMVKIFRGWLITRPSRNLRAR